MSRRGRRLRIGAVLLGLALVHPAWLTFVGAMASRTTRVDVPLAEGKDLDLPVHVAWPGRFSLKLQAKAALDADPKGEESCLLSLQNPYDQPPACGGMSDRLHLNYRLENRAGEPLKGQYGIAMAGRYPDAGREYGRYFGQAEMGAELLILEELERGDYRLRLSAVHVPEGLAVAAPHMVLERHESMFAFAEVLPLLALSAVLGLAGVVMVGFGLMGKRIAAG